MSSIRPTPKGVDISDIPPEILSEIFIHCPPVDFVLQSTQPLVLSSVCKLWRTLALATPALWASLDIRCRDFIHLYPSLSAIQIHVQRSRTHPLSFAVRVANSFGAGPGLIPIFMALASARQRWHNVYIELNRMTQEILDLITLGDAPLLQNIQCDILRDPQDLSIPLHMLHSCPRLESFHWRSFGSPLPQPLGSTQLTSLLLLTALSISECVTLLRLSPRLSSAAFYGLNSDHSIPPHLTHPALRTLTAVGEHSNTLLAALTLPALLNLKLATGFRTTGLPAQWEITLTTFLERSNPTLHQLSLSINYMQSLEPAIPRILALTPHLRSLELSNCLSESPPCTVMLIRVLEPQLPSGAPLCPCLRRLRLSGIEDCPDGLCGAMLRARWGVQALANGVAPLEWAHITFNDGVHNRDQADVQELFAEGMKGKLRVKS